MRIVSVIYLGKWGPGWLMHFTEHRVLWGAGLLECGCRRGRYLQYRPSGWAARVG